MRSWNDSVFAGIDLARGFNSLEFCGTCPEEDYDDTKFDKCCLGRQIN